MLGAVAGGLAGWLAICAGFFWYRKRNARNRPGGSRNPGSRGAGSEVGMAVNPKGPRPYTTLLV